MEQWEEFETGAITREMVRVRASLTPKKVITLNKVAIEKLGKPEAVVLLFDKVNLRIGIKPSYHSVANSYPVRYWINKRPSARIYASQFCRYHRIKTDPTLVFMDIKLDADGILILELKRSYEVSRPWLRKPELVEN